MTHRISVLFATGRRPRRFLVLAGLAVGLLCPPQLFAQAPTSPKPQARAVMWINPLAFLAGDPSVTTTFNAVNSGVGGGLSGLIIQSKTLGDTASGGGNKVVEVGLQVPPRWLLKGVRVCYELSNPRSFISQLRLSQLQDPPSSASVMLDDGTDLNAAGPKCSDSQPASIDPAKGAVSLSLRVSFADVTDRIVLRGVGLHLAQ